MMMNKRRQVLRGAGGFALSLPFLPSLAPRSASAQGVGPKRFIAFGTNHGGVRTANMYPADTALTSSMPMYANHPVRFGKLAAQNQGGTASLSKVLTAPSGILSNKLVAKMNVLRGFDFSFYAAHQIAGHLGNFAEGSNGLEKQGVKHIPTIDQVLAWSSRFYPNLTGIVDRSVAINNTKPWESMSWGYADPQAQTGIVSAKTAVSSIQALFDRLVAGRGGGTQPPMAMERPSIVDRIIANYRSLRQSNRRLSIEDRARIDAHVGRLSELERSLLVAQNPVSSASCGEFSRPTIDSVPLGDPIEGLARARQFWSLMTDVMAMALACGSTRIMTALVSHTFSDYVGSWHQDIAHNSGVPANQEMLTQAHRQTFEFTIAKLAATLDGILDDAQGNTILDNSLVQWTQESGTSTHNQAEMPIITFGSSGGFFKTGNYVNYTGPLLTAHAGGGIEGDQIPRGLLHRQWLANVLLSFGLPQGSFEASGLKGYGLDAANLWDTAWWSRGVADNASAPLPVVAA